MAWAHKRHNGHSGEHTAAELPRNKACMVMLHVTAYSVLRRRGKFQVGHKSCHASDLTAALQMSSSEDMRIQDSVGYNGLRRLCANS